MMYVIRLQQEVLEIAQVGGMPQVAQVVWGAHCIRLHEVVLVVVLGV